MWCCVILGCDHTPAIVSESIGSADDDQQEVVYSKKQLNDLKTASKVVYDLPSPTEMAQMLHDMEVIYDVNILSNPKSEGIYNIDVSRALNLGVYFADLSFTTMFDFPQQAMLFMSAVQGLSEELNIVGVFNEQLMSRLEDNLSNKDSIMDIVSYTYMETDFYLQENERSVLAKAILAGAWVEGLYIATHLKTEQDQDQLIWQKIAAQKKGLKNLINMVEDCNEPQLNLFVLKLRKLETAFDQIKELSEHINDHDSIQNINQYIVSDTAVAQIIGQTSGCRDYMVIGK